VDVGVAGAGHGTGVLLVGDDEEGVGFFWHGNNLILKGVREWERSWIVCFLLGLPAARSFLEHPRKEPKEGCHCVGL
jgi:hypothetical protein